jgi:hypothetical protein
MSAIVIFMLYIVNNPRLLSICIIQGMLFLYLHRFIRPGKVAYTVVLKSNMNVYSLVCRKSIEPFNVFHYDLPVAYQGFLYAYNNSIMGILL